MVVITRVLTIGQLTFILRVAVQILTLSGPFFIGLIILSNAPRMTSFSTHDVINRIMGRLSLTKCSIVWIWNYIRQPKRDPGRSFQLVLAVALLVLYGLFSSLSDIGFLGFYTCSAPAAGKYNQPASVRDEVAARSIVLANFVNGTDPNSVKAYRCNSSSFFQIGSTSQGRNCTAWHNSTWVDIDFFSGINTTDSDMLLPQKLSRSPTNITTFSTSVRVGRTEGPSISGGMFVNPTNTSLQVILGVPQLDGPLQVFTVDKAMELEVETGCMTLGIGYAGNADSYSRGVNFFITNGKWRQYSGPDILKDILSKYVDTAREYWKPNFNTSTLDSNGIITSFNYTTRPYSAVAYLEEVFLPDSLTDPTQTSWLMGNCTNAIREKLGLPPFDLAEEGHACRLLGLRGPIESDGKVTISETTMLCATISQINMVSATVRSDAQGSVSLAELIRLPSRLNYVVTDIWDYVQDGEDGIYVMNEPYKRYTLSDDVHGPTSHYIVQGRNLDPMDRVVGAASGGYILSEVGSVAFTALSSTSIEGLNVLGEGSIGNLLDRATVTTRWAGQIGASFIVNSLQYNPWAALNAPPILITSSTGRSAICYHPVYLLGFAPLVLSALFILVWSVVVLIGMPYRHLKALGDSYGGMYPTYLYWKSAGLDMDPSQLALIWKREPNIHLNVFSAERPVSMETDSQMAVDYLALMSVDESETFELAPRHNRVEQD